MRERNPNTQLGKARGEVEDEVAGKEQEKAKLNMTAPQQIQPMTRSARMQSATQQHPSQQ